MGELNISSLQIIICYMCVSFFALSMQIIPNMNKNKQTIPVMNFIFSSFISLLKRCISPSKQDTKTLWSQFFFTLISHLHSHLSHYTTRTIAVWSCLILFGRQAVQARLQGYFEESTMRYYLEKFHLFELGRTPGHF